MAEEREKKRLVDIKVPANYRDVNEKVWKELEEYLFTGFLHSPAKVLGRSFVFKSLNHLELRNINFLRPAAGSAPEIRAVFRSAMIAYSIFIADGVNVLHNRPDHVDRLVRVVSKIPEGIQEKIVDNVASINSRASRLHPLVEPYCQDSRSRFQWMQTNGRPIHLAEVTGIPGTTDLGMNYCQQTWMALNRLADIKDQADREWAHAKFVGSCFNGKGVRQVDEQDKARRNREKQEFEERKMQAIRHYLNKTSSGRDESADLILPDGRRAVVEGRFRADSAEELANQLSATMSGEKDQHDLIIEEHFRKARAEMEVRESNQQRFGMQLPNRVGDSVGGGSDRVGTRVLPKDDVDSYIHRVKSMVHGWDVVQPSDRGENFDERRVIDTDDFEE